MYAQIQTTGGYAPTATMLFVGNVLVELGASASVQWWLHDASGSPVQTGTLFLASEDYAAWKDDPDLFAVVASHVGCSVLHVLPGGIPVVDLRTPHVTPIPHADDEPVLD